MKAGHVAIILQFRLIALLVLILTIPTLRRLLVVLIVMGKTLVQIQVCQNHKIVVLQVQNINLVMIQDQLAHLLVLQMIWIQDRQVMMVEADQVVVARRVRENFKDCVNYIHIYLNVKKVLKVLIKQLRF